MDLGIRGKRALVCGASRGLGYGCAEALAREGVDLVINSRSADSVAAAAEKLRQYGVDVVEAPADITTEEGRASVLAVCGDIDILVTNAGGPPPGMWTDWDRKDFIAALDANMLTPIALMKALMPAMIERQWGRVVNITSVSVKSPIPILGLSNSARAGLTGYVGGTARQVAKSGVIINNLLPGVHGTERALKLDQVMAESQGISVEQFREKSYQAIPAGRYGTAEEFGATCAFLCSQHAGFMVGQNVLLDGGAYNSTM